MRLRDDLAYWPGFPWHDLALTYDAILPMTYFTFRAHGPDGGLAYVTGSIDEIRDAGAGRPGPDPRDRRHRATRRAPETPAFVRAVPGAQA